MPRTEIIKRRNYFIFWKGIEYEETYEMMIGEDDEANDENEDEDRVFEEDRVVEEVEDENEDNEDIMENTEDEVNFTKKLFHI